MIEVSNVCKGYAGKMTLENVSLRLEKGDFATVFGPNGCGKTTLLNVIAGIIRPDSGSVAIDGGKVRESNVGFVFQDYRDSLLPWRTNLENIAFPLELHGVGKARRLELAEDLVAGLNVRLPLSNYPYQSSGGEQQLVSFLREVMAEPKIILMDEPFSAVDHESREYLKVMIQKIWERLELTILFVTHDVYEAVQLGNRVIVMGLNPGRILKTVDVSLPRPRTEDDACSGAFRRIMNEVSGGRVSYES